MSNNPWPANFWRTPVPAPNGLVRQVTSVQSRSVTTERVASAGGLRERVIQREVQQVFTREVSINGQRCQINQPSGMFEPGFLANHGSGVRSRLNQPPPPRIAPIPESRIALIPGRTSSNLFNSFNSRFVPQPENIATSGRPSRGRLCLTFDESRRRAMPWSTPNIHKNQVKPYARLPLSPRTTPQPRNNIGSNRNLGEDKGTQTSPALMFNYVAGLQRRSARHSMLNSNCTLENY